MRVLHVVPTYVPAYSYGGPVKAVHDLCSSLARKGLNVSVFTSNMEWAHDIDVPLRAPVDIDGVSVTYYPVRYSRKFCVMPDLRKALLRKMGEVDIVHVHSVFLYPTLISSRLCSRGRVPYILNPFGALDPDMLRMGNSLLKFIYMGLFERRNIENAAALHVTSEYEKERVLSLGFRVPVVVVPRGIDMAEYSKNVCARPVLRRAAGIPENKKIVLFLGRIHYKKGLDILAGALKRVVSVRNDVCLVVAGPDERGYAAQAREKFAKEGVLDNVFFVGQLTGEQKVSALHECDVFVLPSRGENFGIAVLEAMACGRPVVVSEHVGLAAEIRTSLAGIVSRLDPDEFASSVLRILDNESLAGQMGKNGMQIAERRYSVDAIAEKMVIVYRDIIDRKKRIVST